MGTGGGGVRRRRSRPPSAAAAARPTTCVPREATTAHVKRLSVIAVAAPLGDHGDGDAGHAAAPQLVEHVDHPRVRDLAVGVDHHGELAVGGEQRPQLLAGKGGDGHGLAVEVGLPVSATR